MTRRLIVLFVLAAACAEQAEKPPPPTCAGRCVGARPGSVGHVPPGGDAGAGGESGTSDEPVRLVGTVELLVNIPDVRSTDFFEPADIVVEGENGDVMGRWNGSDPFSIDGVVRGAGVWALATPFQGDALRTLQPVDTRRPNDSGVVQTRLQVVSASEIELALGAISSPLTPNPARAQALLVATEGQIPASGVSVSAPGAEAIIYVQNGAFTDADTVTDSSGIFILANVPPEESYTVTLSGEVDTSADLRLVSGGVTFGAVGN